MVKTAEDFLSLQRAWNPLLLSGTRPTPFLTWEWISTWWKHFHGGSELFLLVAKDESGQIIGLAPLKIAVRRAFGLAPVRVVEFLGYRGSAVCSDHMDFLAPTESRDLVVEQLVKTLFEHSADWDALALADIAEDSPLKATLTRSGIQDGGTIAEGTQEVCPYLSLPCDWESFFGSLRRKRRWNTKTQRERLEKSAKVDFITESSSGAVPDFLETLAKLHCASHHSKGELGNFERKEYRAFHEDVAPQMARAGFLYLTHLRCDGQPVAAAYNFHIAGRVFYYQTGYDPSHARAPVSEPFFSE